ncbi:hypothetical protein SAMIE_1008460 [Sphingobium amiense]|uniref:RadC-like JAB domain-containing protein n=1 Tax=Sphingobium amiense TaxID=135719 RepID=A0A494WA64_9SPHN|nr:JAB domain-containing protein [Sphingobium amiense]BBD97345.1 hypothetical protein SAMIE_1008460 [Sphingobium amiense]
MQVPDPHPMLAVLDAAWRPQRMVPLDAGWQGALMRLMMDEESWVAIIQRRASTLSPAPRAADLMLTRSLFRSLHPLGIGLADHVIEAGHDRFSFRTAGLL